ncbi:class I SAM-dependent methyltransferase [Actinoallomurus spadix]|uniref:Methyltransferase domain-containing protein n=1 Tax=Actinoallomurus spadix TaxID=79912 RepID=A0ABN0WIG0_9ACTN|nr:methyltransferase domain-containing protein [Actinoallomurus spadix]MCO5989906.1 class I SAM-dependent methyltransferase [Actinoallomurus spadix]
MSHQPHRHQNADEPGALIRGARLYELGAVVGFLGRRRRVYDDLVTLSGARPGDRILDVGCGTGYLTRRAARAVLPGGHATGIDPSAQVIAYATRRAPAGCTFQTAAAQAIPYPDGSFDVVISSLAVHHIPAADRPAALAEFHRVLRPGGRLLLADYRRRPRHLAAARLVGAAANHAHEHTPADELTGLVTQAGFGITETGTRRPSLQFVGARR